MRVYPYPPSLHLLTSKTRFGSAAIDGVRENFRSQYTAVLAQIQRGESEHVYLKVVDQDPNDASGTGTMIAWAGWMLSEDESAPKSNGALPGPPPPGINLLFCSMACRAIEDMRTKVLQGKKCYSKSNTQLKKSDFRPINGN